MFRVRERSSARGARQRLRFRLRFPFAIRCLRILPSHLFLSFFRAFPTEPLPRCVLLLLTFRHLRLFVIQRQALIVRTSRARFFHALIPLRVGAPRLLLAFDMAGSLRSQISTEAREITNSTSFTGATSIVAFLF